MAIDVNAIVEDHRKLLAISGGPTDMQLNNLQKWGLVVFGTKCQVELSYDFDTISGSHGSVTYAVKGKLIWPKDKRAKAFEELAKWVKYLFFNDTVVTIKSGKNKWKF